MNMTNLSIQNAYHHCETLAKSHYENFPVGSLLIPKAKRPHIWSIYAFARMADDFADEGYPSRNNFSDLNAWRDAIVSGEQKRLEQLDAWETQLKACYEGEPSHPIFIALAQTIRELQIPMKPLQDLLIAFKMDVTKRRYANWEEVLHYCQHSANPVGRLVLMVFGYQNEELFELSDAICTGLQLANFWQDISIDREKDRIYIPLDLLKKYNASDETVLDPSNNFEWGSLLRDLGKFTETFFIKGSSLPSRVKGQLSWELRTTWLGGMTILKRACMNHRRSISERPKVKKMDWVKILLKSFFPLFPASSSLSLDGRGLGRG
jgi:squalene synthase HpnC